MPTPDPAPENLVAHAPLIIVCVGGAAAGIVYLSWWCVPLLLCLLFIFRGFFVGFLNVLLIRRQAMELFIEQNSLGFLIGNGAGALR